MSISIIDAIRDENLFRPFLGENLFSWRNWQTALRVLYGLPVKSEAGRKLIRQCTGRNPKKLPSEGFETAIFLTGRRSGKSRMAAVIGAYSACLAGLESRLAAGEHGLVPVICPTKRQGEIVKNYLRAIFDSSPMLRQEVGRDYVRGSFTLANGVTIEVLPGDYRKVRGFSVLGAVVDEICFFGQEDDSKVRSDTELIRAVLPTMATTGGRLICIGSPYSRRGWTYQQYQKHWANDRSATLIWNAASRTMNPTLRQSVVDKAMREDMAAALSEYEGQWRDDVSAFLTPELIEALVVKGRTENLKLPRIRYHAFADLSGGRGDGAALAIAHKDGRKIIHDAMYHWRAPFNPHLVIAEMAQLLRKWELQKVHTDHYSADFVTESFRSNGISSRACVKPKSQLYVELLPIISSGEIEILDHPHLVKELCALERRTRSGGKDVIDHPPRGHDDSANVLAGVATLCCTKLLIAGAGGF